MRIKLTLSVLKRQKSAIIPVNYQYELSSLIYKTLKFGNPEFSEWLHTSGYTTGNKKFKLFTFSHLNIPKFKINNDRLEIFSPEVSLIISFLPLKTGENFIIGIFKNQSFGIGDKFNRTDFVVKSVERIPEPNFSEIMNYRCLSPVFIDKEVEGKKYKTFLSPDDKDYESIFVSNLISKMLTHDNVNSFDLSEIKLKPYGKIRKKGVNIKTATPQETKLIGYMFDFELSAPPEIQKMGYYAGFGRLNSQGFGCCKIIS